MRNATAALTCLFTLTFVLSPLVSDPFSGFSEDQLPVPQIDPPIQPEGYAFAIWGLIYGWLVVSAVYGLLRRADDAGWNRARPWLIVSLAVGTPWLAVAGASAIWATVLIFVMAASAIIGLLRCPRTDPWTLRVPVAIYAGWLTAASFVALGSTAAGYAVGPDAFGWAIIGILGALSVAAPVAWASRATAYALTVIWALVAIIVANGFATLAISGLAAFGVLVMAAIALRSNFSDPSAFS